MVIIPQPATPLSLTPSPVMPVTMVVVVVVMAMTVVTTSTLKLSPRAFELCWYRFFS
jgi:hypothetical protein